jgi:uncharacterized Ntn-hydrolase superfamily protein
VTFSIVARDAKTGELGAAVASAVPNSGRLALYLDAQLGAACIQGAVDEKIPTIWHAMKDWLRQGAPPDEAIRSALADDPDQAARQIGIVTKDGQAGALTGNDCKRWAGDRKGRGFSVQGNMIVGPDELKAMADAFSAARGPLAQRLLAALVAGEKAGGDKRWAKSAAILTQGPNDPKPRLVEIQQSEHPVADLGRQIKAQAEHFKAT